MNDPVLTPAVVALLAGVGVASYTDVTTGRIPNWLTGAVIVVGLFLGVVEGAALASAVGLVAAFAIHFPLWALRVEKGGDAKLLMGVGALLGWAFVVEATLWCAVLYLPVGLGLLAAQGRLGNLVRAVQWTALKARGVDPGPPPPPTMLRTAPIIACAAVAALLTGWLDFAG